MPRKSASNEMVLPQLPLRDKIIQLLGEHPGELFKTNEISKMLAIKSDTNDYQSLRNLLGQLESDGLIERTTRRRYGLPKKESIEKQDSPPAKNELRVNRLTGKIEHTKRGFLVRPESGKIKRDVFISRKDLHGAQDGDRVTIELYDVGGEHTQPEGFVLNLLEQKAREEFSNEAIISEYNLPERFPSAVLKEADKLPDEIPESEIAKRLDLRGETIFTIDPEDAKDFDDAVSLTPNEDGTVTIGVHIADVSHYVRESTALDEEALARGTSVYLVGSVVPMLPERISNELCSLRPDEDKLAYSVFLNIEPETGKVTKAEIKKTIIRSVMRFSYEEAERRIKTGRGKHAKLLKQMRALSLKMYELRREMGSIDFETEEFRFRFEGGKPVESMRKERLGSMRMIEDFMLAANRAVAEFISRKAKQGAERPFLYRIHAEPDPTKMRDLAQLAKTLGYKLSADNPTPKTVQKFLESLKGKPEEHLLNQLMLRTMAKAVYAEHNVGHFGLAFLHYTHFTSPIRRYPDLIVHRMLGEYQQPGGMNREREHHYFQSLPEIADATSASERAATDAERASIKLAQVHLLKDKVGDEFDAVISGVTHFGMFVAIPSGAEGLVHIRELPGYYEFDEAHYSLIERQSRHGGKNEGRRFRIGDTIRVQLIKVLEEKRQVDFRLADSEFPPSLSNDASIAPEKLRRQKLHHERVAGAPRKAQRPQRRSR